MEDTPRTVEVHRRDFCECNTLRVEVGTNCPQGGDTGHGGRTVLRLIDKGSTHMEVSVDGDRFEQVGRVELLFGGDCERSTLIEALEFSIAVLKKKELEYHEVRLENIAFGNGAVNVGNMSDRRFQNTLTDLQDCSDNMTEDDLSEEEAKARLELIGLCEWIGSEHGHLLEGD